MGLPSTAGKEWDFFTRVGPQEKLRSLAEVCDHQSDGVEGLMVDSHPSIPPVSCPICPPAS